MKMRLAVVAPGWHSQSSVSDVVDRRLVVRETVEPGSCSAASPDVGPHHQMEGCSSSDHAADREPGTLCVVCQPLMWSLIRLRSY